MNTAQRNPRGKTTLPVWKVAAAAFLFLLFLAAPTTLAVDQPPQTAPQQRAWLLSQLVTDMQSAGAFSSNDIAKMVTLINSLSDDQVALLAQYYYLTREKTEQDAQLYALQQTSAAEALAESKAQVADLLAQLQSQITQSYSSLAAAGPACQTLCQIVYASVPGWCAYNRWAVPDWYYTGGCFVGPVYSAGYCGPYAVPVYNAFYNHGSRYNFWNSRAYVHNHVLPTGRPTAYAPIAQGPASLYSLAHPGAPAAPRSISSAAHTPNRVKKANRVASHAAAHSHARPAGRPKARPQNRTASHAKKTGHAASHARHAGRGRTHAKRAAHAASRGKHAGHAASHAKHAGHAAHHAKHAGHAARGHSAAHGRRK
jgi:hypothetical protein